ncbi:MAG: TRAP transporter substrate-binding protein [Propionibacteriaceae bacterium]|jgi:tripartite ATP-independent transporter DctP family solute receptor|nr:TRAP transporter substrate-binding protein [Propionibacteriaceae bacterium]
MFKKSLVGIALACMLLTGCLSSGGTATTQPSSGEDEVAAPADATVLKLGHIAPQGTAYDNLARAFKALVEEKTEGRYTIDIYDSGNLGADDELMENLQTGVVDLTVITASDINQFAEEMSVQDLPYLFTSWEHVEKFLDSDTATELYTLTDSAGMKTLGFMARGFRHVTTNTGPITTPADLKGVKIRVAESKVYADTFGAFGANTTTMAWGEVYTALQQGTIDAQENTVITTRDYKINEVQKYLSLTSHFFAFAAIQMNPDTFAGMSAEDQAAIQAAATEATKSESQTQKANEQAAIDEMKAAGLEVNDVPDLTKFSSLVQPIYDDYLANHDKKYFDAIKALEP